MHNHNNEISLPTLLSWLSLALALASFFYLVILPRLTHGEPPLWIVIPPILSILALGLSLPGLLNREQPHPNWPALIGLGMSLFIIIMFSMSIGFWNLFWQMLFTGL